MSEKINIEGLFSKQIERIRPIKLKTKPNRQYLGKKILRNFDDCFSSRTLKTEVATTMGKNIMKLNIAAVVNINNSYSL